MQCGQKTEFMNVKAADLHILQHFDWLATFHLELLKAILLIAVQLSAECFSGDLL
jgi:hypothetical protein